MDNEELKKSVEVLDHKIDHSKARGKLYGALAKAQGIMENAKKVPSNPFFKSTYADLASCWDSARDPLSKNELCLIQLPSSDGNTVTVTSILGHSSGQEISSILTMKPVKNDPQGIGSCITYARRYAMQAIVGIAPEDDDGNAASNTPQNKVKDSHTKTSQRPVNKAPNANQPQMKFDPTEMIEAFKSVGKTIKDMEAHVQTNVANFTQKERAILIKWYTQLVNDKKASGEVAL